MQTNYFIPQYLQKLPIWILWKKELDHNGKPTKVLYSANYNGRAKTNDSSTWCDYKKALSQYQKSKNYNGVGIVVSPETNIVFIDIDHCFKDGTITPQAESIISKFPNSFIELSQSGEGVHILTLGTIERNFKNSNAGIEMYFDRRFIAMTGNAINPVEPTNEQKSLDEVFKQYVTEKQTNQKQCIKQYEIGLSEKEILDKAISSDKNGSKFGDLYNGNWQRYFSSQSEADQSFMNLLAFWCNRDVGMMDSIFRSSCLYRDKWNRNDYRTTTIQNAIGGCDKCYAEYMQENKEKREREKIKMQEQEVKTTKQSDTFNSVLVSELQTMQPELNYKMDDKGNGELFADVFKDKARYNVTANQWYIYDGKKWLLDIGGMEVSRMAKELADALLVYSVSITDEDKSMKYRQYVSKLGQRRYRQTMIEDAKDKFYITNDDLDRDLYLLNCQNGVVNLKTFEILNHNAELLLSKICNVDYNKNAECKDFLKFIYDVMQGNQEKVEYLQKLLGYALTGDTREETCYILYGQTTRNGKSTLVETIAYMLGNTNGYSMNMKPETLANKQNNDSRQASGDIARLKGTRFLNASEPPKRMVFDVGLLKNLTGRDSITARHLHEREFEFTPVFKLFINTNFLPLITDDTLFSSGRINVITFDRHFEPHEQDKTLKDRLRTKDSLSGILNWCIEGLMKYYKDGAVPPQSIIDATSEYRANSDKVGNFISERLEPSSLNCKAKEGYEAYQEWCKDNGYGSENKGNFYAELRSKGILANTGTVNGVTTKNVIIGYIISSEFEPITGRYDVPFK